jgi:PAS domain S-box-containing protein
LDQDQKVCRVIRFGFKITELEKTRQALEESEWLWKFALEGAKEGIWDWNIKTNKVFFSRRCKEMLGFSEHEIEDNLAEWESRIHPDDYNRTFEALNSYLRGETNVYDCEHRLRCKDGSYRWIRDRGLIMQRDHQGQPVRAIGTHFDVTERKKMEDRLRQNQEKYCSLYKKTPAMLHSIDPQGRLISVSDQWLEKMGYSRDEVIGRPSIDFLTPASRKYALEKSMPQFLEQGFIKDLAYQMVTKQGKIMDVLLSSVAEYDAQGRIARSLAVITDVSAKKRIEDDLRRSKEDFQAVVQDTPALICRFEPNGKIAYVNQAYYDFFNLSESELVGMNFLDLIPEEQREFVWQKFTSLTPENPVVSYEHQVISPDSQISWQRWTDRAIFNAQGLIEAYQSIGIDITEVVTAKQEIQKKIEEQSLLLDCIPIQMWYLTDIETYGRVNQAHADFLGLPKTALENKKLGEFLDQKAVQVCKQTNQEVFIQKKTIYTQEWLTNWQGEPRLLKVTKTPKLSGLGEVEYIVCSATDITEQYKLNC